MTGPPRLEFEVLGAAHEPHAAQPTLRLDMSVTEQTGAHVLAVTLTAQVMLEPAKRRYAAAQREALFDLFGAPERWPATTHPFLWTFAGTVLHDFEGAATFGLALPCTADLEFPASRYIDALGELPTESAPARPGGSRSEPPMESAPADSTASADSTIPIALHFSGRVLHAGEDGRMQVAHIGWDTIARHGIDFEVWRAMIAAHHGDMRFVRVHKDTLDALTRRKSAEGRHTYDDVIEHLLEGAPCR